MKIEQSQTKLHRIVPVRGIMKNDINQVSTTVLTTSGKKLRIERATSFNAKNYENCKINRNQNLL